MAARIVTRMIFFRGVSLMPFSVVVSVDWVFDGVGGTEHFLNDRRWTVFVD